ncbi:dTDP-4-dehydrorhamnose reductase family protein [Roseateles sp.]|uniref:dTDP-4-dehydrorhamnose reductase family protein n=1 Tax=Roseateles sp. TaxID=1971397 RepID=UPI003BA5B86B
MTNPRPTTVLVLGASGMLGNAVLRLFAASHGYVVFGSMRSAATLPRLPRTVRPQVITGIDVENTDSLMRLFATVRPQVVINCVGVIKQLVDADDPLLALPINAMLPHRLARLCEVAGARLVHVSTDCVFSGAKGAYVESDVADAHDLYGRSKLLGEVDYPAAVTLRTSIIGHELGSAHGLVGWFLAQQQRVKGYRQAIFSGLPTDELARVIRDHVLPRPELRGTYHVSAAAINKFELLTLISRAYCKQIEIVADDAVQIDRSLDSSRFRAAAGYAPDDWPTLIDRMRAFQAAAAD